MFHELDETQLCIGGTERSVSSDLSALLIISAIRDVKYRKTKVLVQAGSAFFLNSLSRFFVKQNEWIELVTNYLPLWKEISVSDSIFKDYSETEMRLRLWG